MGAGRYSKMPKEGKRGSSDSSDLRTKRYIRKALELGLSSGYLIPNDKSDGQVLRVASDIVKLGRCSEEGTGSDEGSNEIATRGRARGKGACGRGTEGKRISTKNGRMNLGKRGRSRTKSPKKPVAQKRRRKRSESRVKAKARAQKRKQMPEARSDDPRTRKNKDDVDDEDNDDEDDDRDEDDEPDTKENGNKNSSDEKKKLPIAERPGTVVPNSDNNSTTNGKNKSNEDGEASGEAASSEEEEEEEEEEEDEEQPQGLIAEEDLNEQDEDLNIGN